MKSQILLITKPVAVKTAIVLGLSLSLISSNQPTLAQTTPPVATPTQTSVVQTSSTSGDFFAPIENVIKEVDQFIGDVRGFVQNDLFGTLNELLSSSLGAIKIPDLSQISREILNAPTSRYEGTQLSDQLENKLGSSDSPGSTAIMSELDRQAQRNRGKNSEADTNRKVASKTISVYGFERFVDFSIKKPLDQSTTGGKNSEADTNRKVAS